MATMQLPDDFKDFFRFLNESGVEYLLIGGWAVGFHGSRCLVKSPASGLAYGFCSLGVGDRLKSSVPKPG